MSQEETGVNELMANTHNCPAVVSFPVETCCQALLQYVTLQSLYTSISARFPTLIFPGYKALTP